MSFQIYLQPSPVLAGLQGYLTGYSAEAALEERRRRAEESNNAALFGLGGGALAGAGIGALLAPYTAGLSSLAAAGIGAGIGAGVGAGIGSAFETNPRMAAGVQSVGRAAQAISGYGVLASTPGLSGRDTMGAILASQLIGSNAPVNIQQNREEDFQRLNFVSRNRAEQIGEQTISSLSPENRAGFLAAYSMTPDAFDSLSPEQRRDFVTQIGGSIARGQALQQAAAIEAQEYAARKSAEAYAEFDREMASGAIQFQNPSDQEKYDRLRASLQTVPIMTDDGIPLPYGVGDQLQSGIVRQMRDMTRRAMASGAWKQSAPPPMALSGEEYAKNQSSFSGVFNPNTGRGFRYVNGKIEQFNVGPKEMNLSAEEKRRIIENSTQVVGDTLLGIRPTAYGNEVVALDRQIGGGSENDQRLRERMIASWKKQHDAAARANENLDQVGVYPVEKMMREVEDEIRMIQGRESLRDAAKRYLAPYISGLPEQIINVPGGKMNRLKALSLGSPPTISRDEYAEELIQKTMTKMAMEPGALEKSPNQGVDDAAIEAARARRMMTDDSNAVTPFPGHQAQTKYKVGEIRRNAEGVEAVYGPDGRWWRRKNAPTSQPAR